MNSNLKKVQPFQRLVFTYVLGKLKTKKYGIFAVIVSDNKPSLKSKRDVYITQCTRQVGMGYGVETLKEAEEYLEKIFENDLPDEELDRINSIGRLITSTEWEGHKGVEFQTDMEQYRDRDYRYLFRD